MTHMDRRVVVVLVLLGGCKAELGDAPGDGGGVFPDGSEPPAGDAAPDAPVMLGPWGTPQRIPGADTGADEDDGTLSSTQLELYFKRIENGNSNLYMMTRASVTSPWGAPVPLTQLNTNEDEESPRLTPDDLTMYYASDGDIYRTTRAAVGMPWGNPVRVDSLSTGAYEKWAVVCPNGYAMVSRAVNDRGQDLFEGTLTTGANTRVDQLNSNRHEQGTFITNDCLRIYFQSNRNNSQFDIYTATRPTPSAAWSNPTLLTEFNTPTNSEEDPWISADQRTFVYAHDAAGSKDLYIVTR